MQTHLSHVFLSRDRVYKLRKAARFDFVDFGSRSERSADCLREVALNRRLAPAVYLGVAAVRRTPAGVRVDPPSESLVAGVPPPEPLVVNEAGCDEVHAAASSPEFFDALKGSGHQIGGETTRVVDIAEWAGARVDQDQRGRSLRVGRGEEHSHQPTLGVSQ